MGSSIRLGRILGIPLGINYSWFIAFLLVTYSLAVSLNDMHAPWSQAERWGVALLASVLLFSSVVAHELCHSLVATRRGIPVKGITLFVFGGVAQISREAAGPGTEFLMAVVGPVSSVLLGLLFLGLHYVVRPFSSHLAVMTEWLFLVNVALGVFNMIPGFPLDGGRVFRAVVWGVSGSYSLATRVATLGGQAVAVAFLALGGFIFMGEEYVQGMWMAFIGWFLWQAASTSYSQFQLRQGLEGYVARDFMSFDCPGVSPRASLEEVMERGLLRDGGRCLVVTEEGLVVGLLTHMAARRERQTAMAGEVMVPIERVKTVGPEEPALRALETLDGDMYGLALVVDGQEVIGVVLRERLLQPAAVPPRGSK